MDSESSRTVSADLNPQATPYISPSNLYDALQIITQGLLPTTIITNNKIIKLFPNKFALIIEQWPDAAGAGFVSLFATFPTNNKNGYQKVLLSVMELEGENAVGEAVAATLLRKARAVTKKLLQPKFRERLRALTDISPVKEDKINVETKYDLVVNFRKLIPFIPQIPVPEVETLIAVLPIVIEHRELSRLTAVVRGLLKCRESLMHGNYTLSEVRTKLDNLVSRYPETKPYLEPNGRFEGDAVFESSVIKVCADASELTDLEYEFVHHLRPEVSRDKEDPKNVSIERLARPFRTDQFMDLRFIVPNANYSEIKLKDAGYDIGSVKNGVVAPAILQQLFLKANSELWGLEEVDALMH